jgi:superfamily II DNA or RNA helicase
VMIPLYAEEPSRFGVPVHWFKNLPSIATEVKDRRSTGHGIKIKFVSEFWKGQDETAAKIRKHLKNGNTGLLFEAPPGFGKTVVMCWMIAELARTALVVVPRSNLIQQWIDRLVQHTSLTKSMIGWAEDGRASWRGKSVVVGLVHTLAMDRFGEDFKRYFGAVFFDEVDRSVPPQTFAPVAGLFPSMYRIGASATFKRQDGLERVFELHMGESYVRGPDANRMKPTVLMVEFRVHSGPLWSGANKLQARGQILSKLAANPARNMMLARYTSMIRNSGRRCLVLSDRTMQLSILRDLLMTRFKVPHSEIGFFCRTVPVKASSGKYTNKTRQVPQAERDRTASACKIMLATYGMFSIGSDIPDLAGLVYATPQSEVEQSKGRIERLVEGKQSPVLVDMMDTCYPQAMGWASKRLRSYAGKNLVVKRMV